MAKRRTRLAVLTAIGFAFVVVGVAVVYWPAALIVAGGAIVAVGVLSDDGGDT